MNAEATTAESATTVAEPKPKNTRTLIGKVVERQALEDRSPC